MVAKWKYKEVEELSNLLSEYPVIGVASIKSLPASQFQEIKANTKDFALIRVARKRLALKAMEIANKDLMKLKDYMEGPIALVFSNVNAFKLFNTLKRMRSKAPAKVGQIAQNDIIIPAGDTGLPPGPALGDLKAAGINARIEGSSIKVIKDSLVTKAGQPISEAVASALAKLGIKPIDVSLKVMAVYEGGTIFTPDVLNIDENETISRLQNAWTNAFNLSINAGYPTSETIEPIVINAFMKARSLAVEAVIPEKDVMDVILANAAGHARALKALVR